MTLEEAKRSAAPVRIFGETQFIVGTPDNCRVVNAIGIMGSIIKTFYDTNVLSSRSFSPTDYANGQMSEWTDRV